jgi:hypothetical protein
LSDPCGVDGERRLQAFHSGVIDMTDPRNVAHDKKVQQEKKHRGEEIAPGADETPQPGKKPHKEHHASDADSSKDGETPGTDPG